MRRNVAALLLCAPGLAAGPLLAQPYPAKPIRVVVGFEASSSTTVNGRLITEAMSQSLGQSMVIDPRPGANGIIGASAVTKADPDGYTIYFGSTIQLSPVLTKV